MPPIPESIGRYKILSLVGRGGMGVLYRALDPMLEREVALKMMHVDFTLDPTARARFEREAKAVARLQHRNVVTLHELGEIDSTPYIVMELLGGKDLDQILHGGAPLTLGEKLDIASQLCEGLGYAHEQGIVHRDIKPANVRVLDDGTVKILDFGIARFATTTVTQSGAIMGTPSYMAPEQIVGRSVDGRADLFSAGVLLYELLAGQKPFVGDSPTSVVYQIVHAEAPPVRSVVPELPEALGEIVSRALQKNPDERYARASEMSADLQMVKMLLDPPLRNMSGETPTMSLNSTLGRLHATQIGGRTASALEGPMRPTKEAAAADAIGRSAAPAPAASSRGVVIATAVLIAAIGLGAAWYFMRPGADALGGAGTEQQAGGQSEAGGPPPPPPPPPGPIVPEAITIASSPSGAKISYDGVDTGLVTPAAMPLNGNGTGTVSLTLPGYRSASAALTGKDLEAGKRDFRLAREAGPVKLTVTSPYPVEVVQGSRVLSESGQEHAVTVQPNGGAVVVRNAELFLNGTVSVDYTRSQAQFSVPEPGTLAVFAAPAVQICKVLLDGTDLSYPPIPGKRVAAGPHVVTLQCPNGREETQRTTVPSGGSQRVEFRQPEKGP